MEEDRIGMNGGVAYPQGTVHAFDFDGTLTTRDTLIEFIRHARGARGLLLCLLRSSPRLVGMRLGLCQGWKVKEAVFSHCFGGMEVEAFDALCARFAERRRSLWRAAGLGRVHEVLERGDRVVIVTASVENWVRPFFQGMEGVVVLGTKAEARDGRLTGRFLTRNCRGAEKVRRLTELLPLRKEYWLVAYGDSRGDIEMLDFANEGHYKPFR